MIFGASPTFVRRIGDALHSPLTFVLRIVNHGRLPLSILFIIPVIWFLGLFSHNALLFDPILGFLVLAGTQRSFFNTKQRSCSKKTPSGAEFSGFCQGLCKVALGFV